MSKVLLNIPYLEDHDIETDGTLKPHVSRGKPSIIMIQGDFCGYCNMAKPDFQQLIDSDDVNVFTIQIDASDSERNAAKKLGKINNSPGVPAYVGFKSDGTTGISHKGGRDLKSLKSFISELKN